jgi:aminoglycoside 3-N-acetyltransferase
VARPRTKAYRCFVDLGGVRITKEFLGIDHDDRYFPQLGAALEKSGVLWGGRLGATTVRVVPIRPAVDFAVRWLTEEGQS